jgi:cobalt/nickel transport system permease protein
MHISEGVLSAPVLIAGAALAVAGTAVGLRKMEYEKLPQVAVLASAFFIASLVHVPVGPSAAHLVLNGLCGLLLGWPAFPAILVGLSLEAILFQFGGITTLGINTFNMAFPAIVIGLICRKKINSPSYMTRATAEFTAGAGSILVSAVLVGISLAATGEAFKAAAWIIIAAHLPVMVVEGIVTVFIVEFIRRVRPEMVSV